MARSLPTNSQSSKKSPFLRAVNTVGEVSADKFPFTIPALKHGLSITFTRPITFLVGENGSGKSTILEAIAAKCGFNLLGGNRNHSYSAGTQDAALAPFLRLSWTEKVGDGFFMRAESFFNFATYLDALEAEDPGVLGAYGGKSFHAQSHGEAFFSLFLNRFRKGVYVLDEPEGALSPQRQLAFLRLMFDLEKAGQAQFIIASHSPLLFSYPFANVLSVDGEGVHQVDYRRTDHYQLTREFLDAPERFFHHLFTEEA